MATKGILYQKVTGYYGEWGILEALLIYSGLEFFNFLQDLNSGQSHTL
jgi:hypothetical protein